MAWKNGVASLVTNEASARVRRTVSRLPLATTPRTCFAFPSLTSFAPTMFVAFGSVMYCAAGEARSWFAARSIAYWKLFAVTGVPSLKRKPLRIVNV